MRWGILGTGRVASDFAIGLGFLTGAEIHAVASRTPDGATQFARRFAVRKIYPSSEALFADDNIDIVYVATPNHLHRTHSIGALDAGKPILCEKPFALNAEEARSVVDLARRRRLFCMEAMWTRFLPAVREVKAIVDAGGVGEIRMLSASLGYACEVQADKSLFRPEHGGGALLDLGVYAISLITLILGQPTAVVSAALIGATGVDEHVSAILTFARDAQAVITVSLRSHLPSDAVIFGTKGQIHLEAPLYRPEQFSIGTVPGPRREIPAPGSGIVARLKGRPLVRLAYHRTAKLIEPLLGRAARTRSELIEGNGYQYQAMEAMRCLREGLIESPLLLHAETVSVLETVDAIRRSWSVTPL